MRNLNFMIAGCLLFTFYAPIQGSELKPLMLKTGKLILEDNFEKKGPIEKKVYQRRQATPWEIKNGVLWGTPNSAEVQAQRAHHKGKEPRVLVRKTPMNFVAALSFKYNGGKETGIAPFIEFGHHVCRVSMKSKGTHVLVESESLKVQEDQNFKFKQGKWYHILVEMKDEEFVIQFTDGPTFYTRHASLPKGKDHYIGFCGTQGGTAEIDNLKIWEAGGYLNSWENSKTKFPAFKPVQVKDLKKIAARKAQQGKKQ